MWWFNSLRIKRLCKWGFLIFFRDILIIFNSFSFCHPTFIFPQILVEVAILSNFYNIFIELKSSREISLGLMCIMQTDRYLTIVVCDYTLPYKVLNSCDVTQIFTQICCKIGIAS